MDNDIDATQVTQDPQRNSKLRTSIIYIYIRSTKEPHEKTAPDNAHKIFPLKQYNSNRGM